VFSQQIIGALGGVAVCPVFFCGGRIHPLSIALCASSPLLPFCLPSSQAIAYFGSGLAGDNKDAAKKMGAQVKNVGTGGSSSVTVDKSDVPSTKSTPVVKEKY
jgi:hypothetical protein